jgi:hypothetical protein
MKKILILLVAVGVIAAALIAVPVDMTDLAHRTVEIAVDYDDVVALAREANITTDEMLSRLRDLGVTAVGLREASITRYRRDGIVTVIHGSDLIHNWRLMGTAHPGLLQLLESGAVSVNATYILSENSDVAGRVASKARLKFQKPVRELAAAPFYVVEIREEFNRVLNLRVGLDQNDVALVTGNSLRIVPRPDNMFIKSAAAARETMAEFLSLPQEVLSAVVFDGTEVTGYPGHISEAADALVSAAVPFGIIEFLERQAGLTRLGALNHYQTLLVHPSIPGKNAQAIANSVRERRVKLVYLRFILSEPDVLKKSTALIAEVVENLPRHGYSTGPAAAVVAPRYHPALLYLVLLGLAAGSTLLLSEVLQYERRWLYAVLALTLLTLIAAIPVLSITRALQLFSILAAGVFVSLAVVSQSLNRVPEQTHNSKSAFAWALVTILRTFLAVAAGGVIVVSLTATQYFLSGTALFHGVKLVHTLPLMLIAPLAFLRIYHAGRKHWDIAGVRQAFTDLLSQPVTVLLIILAAAAAVAAYIYVGRTGHTAGIPVSGLEIRVRQLLGDILVVRPRFKEFMIGYPLLLLGLAFLAAGYNKSFTAALIVAGSIAPVSMINTFMHFTTPAPLSDALIRSFNGLWLGVLLGAILYLAATIATPHMKKVLKL